MKPKTLAILAGVVAALALFIVFVERDLPSTDERKEGEKRLFELAADDVVALTIEWDGETIELERQAKPNAEGKDVPALPPPREWRLTAPLSARADRTLADRLAGSLAGLESERRLTGAARADVGLAPPRGRVRWRTPAAEGALEIGGDVPASSTLVAAVEGRSDPFVIPRTIVSDLDREPGDWRAKEVLPATRDQIERIRIVPAGGGEEIVLSRKGARFAVERPYTDDADPDTVDPLLTDLTSLRVESFLDAPFTPEAERGLGGGPGRLELALEGETDPYGIEVGAEIPQTERRYVRAGGQAFEARTRLAEAIVRAADAWRSKRWTGFDSWRVERLKASDAEGEVELTRSSGDWLRDGVKVPYTEVGDLLYAITSARAERVDPVPAAVTEQPTLTLILSDADGSEETLTLYAALADGVPARRSGRDATLVLPQSAADEVGAKLAAVRAAKGTEESAGDEAGEGAAATEEASED